MKSVKKIQIYLIIIIVISVSVTFLTINYSRGYITQNTPLDTTLHESTLASSIGEGLVITDFEMVAGPGQSGLSFSFLPGTWRMKIKVMYENKLLEQEIASCVNWGKGAGLPSLSVECDQKIYLVELGNKELIVYKATYDLNTDKTSNKLKVVTVPIPESIKTLYVPPIES